MGLRVSDHYSESQYLSAKDIGNEILTLKIRNVAMEIMSDENETEKMAISFEGFEKMLVLNKTNATELAETISDDTSEWIGKEIDLFVANVQYKGRREKGVRVRLAKASE